MYEEEEEEEEEEGERCNTSTRGNLLAVRRIRADCLPFAFGGSKRAQTSLTPTLSAVESR